MNELVLEQEPVKKTPIDRAKAWVASVASAASFAMTCGMNPMAFSYSQASVNTSMSTDAATMLGSAIGMILMVIAGFGIGVLIVGFVDVAQSFMSDQPEKRTKGFALITAGVIMIGLRSILIAAGVINS